MTHLTRVQGEGSLGEASYTDEAEDDDDDEEVGSEEEDEEEVRGRLLDAAVSEPRAPPGFAKLTWHQRAPYAHALNLKPPPPLSSPNFSGFIIPAGLCNPNYSGVPTMHAWGRCCAKQAGQ